MTRLLFPAVLLVMTAASAAALPLMPFIDTKTFATRATDVLVADCLDPDVKGGPKNNGITEVRVDVVRVLKGERKAGKATLVTIGQPMEKGRRYLMASFGGSVGDITFLANADLAVVEIPAGFDLKTLSGKAVPEQMQLVFDARREQVRVRLIQLEHERKLLEQTAPAPKAPAKLDPPVLTVTTATRAGDQVRIAFEVTNPNADPLPYIGYAADSSDPKTPAGTIAPLYRVELLRGKEWKPHQVGWCGTGKGPVAIPAKGTVTFDAHVPAGDWADARVGLIWYATADRKEPQVAWSKPVGKGDAGKGDPPPR